MNLDLVMEVAQLALSLLENALNGAQPQATVANTLLVILRKTVLAYEQHTGRVLNPALIKSEEPV